MFIEFKFLWTKASVAVLIAFFTVGMTASAYAANGFDTAFGSGGKVVMNGGGEAAGVYSTIFAVAVDPSNGKIYATGPARLAVANATGISVARQNPDGTPDSTFGVNGRRILSFPNGSGSFYNAQGSSLAIQPDGGVVVAGRVANLSSGGSSAVLFRFTSAGVLDPTFGPDGSGTFISTFGAPGASLNSLVRQSDGTFIAAGGVSSGNFLIAKFTTNGTLDTTFGSGGFVTTDFNGGSDSAASVLLQSDGRIIAGGVSSNNTALARYNANGSLDTSFGTGGRVVTAVVANNPDYFSKILLQSDGKIVGIGIAAATGFERHLLVRYNANGTLDNSFGSNGIAGGYFGNSQEFLTNGVLTANGKIFVVGYSSGTIGSKASVARYNADGSVDRGFLCNGFGITYFDANSLSYNYAAALQADGKVIAAGQGRSTTQLTDSFALARYNNSDTPTQCAANDFDRDGSSDLSLFRPANSTWYINRSSNPDTFNALQFGVGTDKLAPADYDGDGRTDIAIWRENVAGNLAYFYVLQSTTNSVRIEQFGLTGDKLTVGDYDGDTKADLSVYRDGAQSNFYYRSSLNNPSGATTYLPWGTTGDRPVSGDYDGDGKYDAAVYRASNQNWYILNSSNGLVTNRTFGLSTDSFVPADYDGDGKTDIAVFRPSNNVWYLLQSSDGQLRYETFGQVGDQLTPADYDGDGKADIAIWRPSTGTWYILQSGTNQVRYTPFGTSGDIPAPTLFVQ